MAKFCKAVLIISLSFMTSLNYAYCVYNNTTGKETFDKFIGDFTATKIDMNNNGDLIWKRMPIINQNDYACNLTNHRGDNDKSYLVLSRVSYTAGPKYSSYSKICDVDVYNKGGYVVVSGNTTTGFKCEVHRDPS